MIGSQFRFQPFGGSVAISAAHDLLLQRLCYCYHVADPEVSRQAYAAATLAAFLERSTPVDKECRRWWRICLPKGTSYICVNPANPAFRKSQPTEPNTVIEDIPLDLGHSILPSIAKTALAERAKHRPPDDPRVEHILEGVTSASVRHVARDVSEFVSRIEQHSAAIQNGHYSSLERVQEATNRLYVNGLFDVEVDCSQFSASVCLLELQSEMNGWIEDGAYSKPTDYLFSYIADGHVSTEVLARVGKSHLTSGRNIVAAALDSTCLWTFQEQIYLALHHYWIAHFIGERSPAKLPYSRMVAEESLVCTVCGLTCGLSMFFDRSMMDIGQELAADVMKGRAAAAERFLHRFCSAFFPIIPKPIAKMVIAYAEILARRDGKEGDLQRIAEAAVFKEGSATGALYLFFNRDYLLLDAAKHIGLDSHAKAYAAAVAGRLIVDQHI